MNTILHEKNGKWVAEIELGSMIIQTASEALNVLMNVAYVSTQKIILHEGSLTPQFFDLKTGLAGEILQKASNYGLQLAIVGDFTNVTSDSLRAFIIESNRGRQIFFLESVALACEKLFSVELR